MGATLFVIPASNASWAGRLALDLKGIPYRHVELPGMIHRPIVRAMGFPGHTVPALILNGERVQGTRPIVRALERRQPEPPLLGTTPEERRSIEEVERFGECELQPVIRRLQPWAVCQRPEAVASFPERPLPLPVSIQAAMVRPVARVGASRMDSNERVVRQVLELLPAMLDRIDDWIDAGVIGGAQPNAGDIQVASTLRVLMNYEDLAPAIRDRRGGQLALRLLPDVPGHMPPVFPADALSPLRAS
jgi:glutathione S-transferase